MISSRFLLAAVLAAGAVLAQEAQVTPLMSKDLPDFPGKEGLMITVVYPPGASDPAHRHNADAFLYVLEGSIVMQHEAGQVRRVPAEEEGRSGADTSHWSQRGVQQTLAFGVQARSRVAVWERLL
jgi:quercetin dioxygenase-like cupin family protein